MIRKLICWLLGHRYRCIGRVQHFKGNAASELPYFEDTYWECQSCGKQDCQQCDFQLKY